MATVGQQHGVEDEGPGGEPQPAVPVHGERRHEAE